MAAQILGTAVSMVTVVVNEAISMSLAALTDFERHHSVSAAALTSFLKSFAALFVNTVVILFLVNGYVRNKLMNRLGTPADRLSALTGLDTWLMLTT